MLWLKWLCCVMLTCVHPEKVSGAQPQPSYETPYQISNNFIVNGGTTNGHKHDSPELQINYYFTPGNNIPPNQNWMVLSIDANANGTYGTTNPGDMNGYQPSHVLSNQIRNKFTVYGGPTNGHKHNSSELQTNYYSAEPGQSPNQNWINLSINNNPKGTYGTTKPGDINGNQQSYVLPNQIWNHFTVYGGRTNGHKYNSPEIQINYYFTPGNYYLSYPPGESPNVPPNQNWINPSINNGNIYQPPPNNPGIQAGTRYYPGNRYSQPGGPSVPSQENNYNGIWPPSSQETKFSKGFPPNARPGTMSQLVPKLGDIHAPSFQWHVGVYTKTSTPYMQICGGSLVKADVVLSAAHCFWNDDVGLVRPALFAVAAGKLLRPWEIVEDSYAKFSDVEDIKIPSRFQGARTRFQDDIAIMKMTSPFEFAAGVKPVCVNFDLDQDRRQLAALNLGTIAGWSLAQPKGQPSQRLSFLQLPYVEIDHCIRSAEPSFLSYITSDKICAGDQRTARALCRGNSGGGLVFYINTIPYIRGIASTAPRDGAGNECHTYPIASFTHVFAHRTFLVDNVPDIAEGCEELYSKENNGAPEQLLQSGNQGSSSENVTSNTDVLEQRKEDKSNSDKNNTETMQTKRRRNRRHAHRGLLELIMPK